MKHKQEIRINFRNDVFKRDKHRCLFCGENVRDAHHIVDRNEMPNSGYVKENGISVCEKHHLMCEEYHISRTWFEGYHPADLYEMIGSSYKKAYLKSKEEK